MTERIVVLVSLAIILIAGVTGINAAVKASGPATTVSDENFTPNAGNVTELSQSNVKTAIYDRQVVVLDENGTRMLEDNDFYWHEDNGTLETIEGGDLDGDTSASISYGYNEPGGEVRGFASIVGYGMDIMSFFIIVLGLGVVLGAVRVLRRVT